MWAWGPSTCPTACARQLASRGCALLGRREGSPGGGALRRCEGRLSSGALPPPAARCRGRLSGSATHVLWAQVCGRGVRHCSFGFHALRGAACHGAGGRPSRGGVAFHRSEGRLVSGAVPPPAARPLGRAARVLRPVDPGRGWSGCGDPAPVPQRALLRAGIARCGAGQRASPGGGCLAPL